MCVLLTHSMVRTHCGGRRCTNIAIECSSEVEQLGTPPAAGVVDTWGAWGSAASSVEASHPLTLESCQFSLLG